MCPSVDDSFDYGYHLPVDELNMYNYGYSGIFIFIDTAVLFLFDFCLFVFKTFSKDLAQEDQIYNGIIASGEDMLRNTESEEEKQELRDKLADLASRWNRVHGESEQRKEVLSSVFSKAKSGEETEKDLDSWLNTAEKNLRDLKPLSCLPNELDAQKKELSVCEVWLDFIYYSLLFALMKI